RSRGAHCVAGPRPGAAAADTRPCRSVRPRAHPGADVGAAGERRGAHAGGARDRGPNGSDLMITPRSSSIRTLLMYRHDTRGLGHITRPLTIANHVLARFPEWVAYVVTRSKVAREAPWPPHQCDLIKLPSRRTPRSVQRTPEEEQASLEQFRTLRSQI